jgi:hypothetical protein
VPCVGRIPGFNPKFKLILAISCPACHIMMRFFVS